MGRQPVGRQPVGRQREGNQQEGRVQGLVGEKQPQGAEQGWVVGEKEGAAQEEGVMGMVPALMLVVGLVGELFLLEVKRVGREQVGKGHREVQSLHPPPLCLQRRMCSHHITQARRHKAHLSVS